MNEIHEFSQFELESLYEAWERYKELLRKCPCHGMPKWSIVEKFYRGMNLSTHQFVDASAGGSLMNKFMDAAYDLIEDMSVANSHWGSDRKTPKKAPDNQQPLQPEANFKPPGFNQQQKAKRKPIVEELFSKYMSKLNVRMETQDLALKKLDTKVDQLAQHSQAAIQNLEVQIGQLARGSQACQQGTLPSDMVINPKEQYKAISLRSRRTVEQSVGVGKNKEDMVEEEVIEEEVVEEDKVEELTLPSSSKCILPLRFLKGRELSCLAHSSTSKFSSSSTILCIIHASNSSLGFSFLKYSCIMG
ncbi:hypothetical protein Q3G72_019426 [Acer saccharum]|nr:hypothetical protein Q3G72_019426 [Acer saccharum]